MQFISSLSEMERYFSRFGRRSALKTGERGKSRKKNKDTKNSPNFTFWNDRGRINKNQSFQRLERRWYACGYVTRLSLCVYNNIGVYVFMIPICKYISRFIQEYFKFLSYLLQKNIPFNVTNMYSNILHDLRIKVIKYLMAKRREVIPCRVTFILDGISAILENSTFLFN